MTSQVAITETESVEVKRATVKPKAQVIIVWRNVIIYIMLHMFSVYGLYLAITSVRRFTVAYGVLLAFFTQLGVTAGAHRLWSHRAYKAKWPLRLFLAVLQTTAFQNDIHEWSRDHRVHHKYSETDADPHNATRGFFFSHIGWLLTKKHNDVKEKGKHVDLSDVLADPIVNFQKRYYLPLAVTCCFLVPTMLPHWLWGESYWNAYFVAGILRYVFTLHMTWLVNSAAHMWGNRPYDRYINPRENKLVAIGAIGEGYHNYHHTFPFDYAASEYGTKLNPTTAFINLMAWCGQAYDRKFVSKEMILQRKNRTGEHKIKK